MDGVARMLIRAVLTPRMWGAVLAMITCLVAGHLPLEAQPGSVVPGRSIGMFHLGDTVDTVSEVLGPTSPPGLLPQARLSYYWPSRHLGTLVDDVSRKIVVLSGSAEPGYRTARGVGVGSSEHQVQSAYGLAQRVSEGDGTIMLVYDREGVAFLTAHAADVGDRVSAVFVFARGTYRQNFPAVTALR